MIVWLTPCVDVRLIINSVLVSTKEPKQESHSNELDY